MVPLAGCLFVSLTGGVGWAYASVIVTYRTGGPGAHGPVARHAHPRAHSPDAAHGRSSSPTVPAASPGSPAGAAPAPSGSVRAPSGPPLGAGAGSGLQDGSASAPSSSGDPLVANGLGSPLCSRSGELSAGARRNCGTSGFQASGAPTSNYAFDVHIDTGAFGLGSGAVASAVQNLLITPLWIGLVWLVHALVVALEWSFTVDLLGSSVMSGVARGLREAQAVFTRPWLMVVLSVASVLVAYNGLVRRRVAQTLGEALVMFAMMMGGLWVIANPAGTVGALGAWANQASLGTLGAVAAGTPTHAQRTLAGGLSDVFSAGVGAPWCYMEFGDVRWCEDPARLDPRLHAAALKLAAIDSLRGGCHLNTGPIAFCAQGAEQAQALGQSAQLLRSAQTNGQLFLALPANQGQRNSINESGSLLHVLCGTSEATKCRGPTAKQAEFRTDNGTWPRAEGLLLIGLGELGMIMVLWHIALRLLSAAIMSLFYLLLAPAAVLAPALGEGGRAAFRGWATRLLGAVTTKLIYSFLLGTVLLMMGILLSLQSLGWWIQWLLISTLWWGVFRHRHQILSFTRGERQASPVRGMRLPSALTGAREAGRLAGWAKRKLSRPAPDPEQRRMRTAAARQRASSKAEEQVSRSLEGEHEAAKTLLADGGATQSRLTQRRGRLARLRSARESALADGDTRRAAKLDVRAKSLEGDLAGEQQAFNQARRLAGEGDRAERLSGRPYTAEQRQQRARWLDVQAALPDNGAPSPGGQRRDYAALSGLIGQERGEYERLAPARQRASRLAIDRELRLRRELNRAAKDAQGVGEPRLPRGEQRSVEREFDSKLAERIKHAGHQLPSSLAKRSPIDAWRERRREKREGPSRAQQSPPVESPVMRDAREVAARRKRQLGLGRHDE